MTVDALTCGCPPTTPTIENFANIQSDVVALEEMIAMYGEDPVALAAANEYIKGACNELRAEVNASDMPQFMKDDYLAQIDSLEATLTTPVPSACQAAVGESHVGETFASEGAAEVQAAAGEAAGESAGGAEGGGGAAASVSDSMMANAAMTRDAEDEEGGGNTAGGGNIMMRIARKMGQAQDDLLQNAMKSLDAMELAQTGGTPTDSFALHQSEFTAYMQLFTITANAASTAMKALGEGVTAVARKQ